MIATTRQYSEDGGPKLMFMQWFVVDLYGDPHVLSYGEEFLATGFRRFEVAWEAMWIGCEAHRALPGDLPPPHFAAVLLQNRPTSVGRLYRYLASVAKSGGVRSVGELWGWRRRWTT